MSKTTPWFKHDADARNNKKLRKVTLRYGVEGYGRYWILCEMLREQAAHSFKLDLNDKVTLLDVMDQLKYRKQAEFEEFITTISDEFGLFRYFEGILWNEEMSERMEYAEKVRAANSNNGRVGAQKRWKQEGKDGGVKTVGAIMQAMGK